MRNVFLIFRRDYLSYVSAWGFWLGILSLPLIIGAIGTFTFLASTSTPTRYYSVIEAGSTYSDAIDAEFRKMEERGLESLEAIEEAAGGGATGELAEAALADSQASAFADQLLKRNFFEVPAPASDLDSLRPWLLGDQTVEGPDGPKPLFAVIIVAPDGSAVEYWSADVNVDDLSRQVDDAVTAVNRSRAFNEAGIPDDFLATVDDQAPEMLTRRVRTVAEQAELGDEVTIADEAPLWVSIFMAYFLWGTIFSVINYLLMGTIEERSNKIFDTLLTLVRLPQLLIGKLLAIFGVTATMMGIWSLASGVFMFTGLQTLPPEMQEPISTVMGIIASPTFLIPTIACFIFGYTMYGVMFMAIGSLCDTVQEAQTLMSPMVMILMIPMMMIILVMNNPTSGIVAAMSWVPIFTPFIMLMRIPADPPLWETVGQIVLMGVTTMVMIWVSSKVYRAGVVHGMGMNEAMAWLKGLVPGAKKTTKLPAE